MQRTMCFIDYQNFNIELMNHYRLHNQTLKSINYSLLARNINEIIPMESQVIKTYLFASKPCDELMQLPKFQKYYDWLESIKNHPYFEVIEGRQEIRTINRIQYDVHDPDTYTTIEKGTDVNMSVQMISKAFQNAYDIAILVSGDTDYIPIVKTLHQIGKTVVLATFPHQNVNKYKNLYDQNIILYNDIVRNSTGSGRTQYFSE
jgi:uncharacterized LabA/DUF88 family protein